MDEKYSDIFSLIWLDANVEENRQTDQKLRSIIKNLKKFNHIEQCQDYLVQTSETDRIILIVSGQLGRQIVPLIDQLKQILSIYIYCMNKQANQAWSSKYSKVKDVVVTLDELVNRIIIDYRKYRKLDEPLSINIYPPPSGQSTVGLNGQFVFSQILIDCLLRLKSNDNDRNDLIEYCRNRYQQNSTELNHLREFQNEYTSEKVLWWYTRESFFYKILNEALRTEDIHLMFLFRSFIYDLQQQLKRNQLKEMSRLYRGQIISIEELNQLRQSTDPIISINSFFSTSRTPEHAKFILGDQTSSVKWPRVFFEIQADPKLVKSKPFADISQFSDFKDESEVLFMNGSIFRLKEIFLDNEQIWNIHMDLCSDEEHELKGVLSYMTEKTGNGSTNLRILGHILRDMGKSDLAVKYLTRLCNELPSNDPLIGDLYEDFGKIESQKGNYNKSIEWYQKSVDFKQQNQIKNSPDNTELIRYGSVYGNLGGGSSFDDAVDLKLPTLTYCVGIEVFWDFHICAIRFIYDRNDIEYRKVYRGNDRRKPQQQEGLRTEKFMLTDNEKFDSVTLYVGHGEEYGGYITVGGKYISFVTGIQFHTTAGRTTPLYGIDDEQIFTESFQGYILGYVKGRCGLCIDEFQFIWYKQSQFDDIWIETEYGRIPSDAFIAGKEKNQHVYIVRFKTKEGKMIAGKLIEGNKIAEGPYLGVRTASSYQILINRNEKRLFQWISTDTKNIPQGALRINNDQGTNYYVGRFIHPSGATLLGQFNADINTFFYIDEGQEKELTDRFEVLCVL